MKKAILRAALILFLCGATLASASSERWIHVRVQNVKGVSGNMSFNLPIELASVALGSIPGDQEHHGRFHLQGSVNGADVRAMLDAVGQSPDNDFVTMERHDKEISVAKAGRFLIIRIADKQPTTDHLSKAVDIRVPVSVVRALVGTNSNDLDVNAGIHALANEGELDVTMNNQKETVRIWTDTGTN